MSLLFEEHTRTELRALAPDALLVLPVGATEQHGPHLPVGGTLSLGTETYYHVLSDLCESLITSGFRRIFILNGHGGNNELIQLVVRDLALKHSAFLAAASYWIVAWDGLVELQSHVP